MPPPSSFDGHWVERAMVTCNLRGRSTRKYLYKTPWIEGGYDDYDAWRVHSDFFPEFEASQIENLQVRIAGRLIACVQTAQQTRIHCFFRDYIGDMAYDPVSGTGHFQLDVFQDSRRFVSVLLRCGHFATKEHYQTVNLQSLSSFLQDVHGGYAHIMMISFRDDAT